MCLTEGLWVHWEVSWCRPCSSKWHVLHGDHSAQFSHADAASCRESWLPSQHATDGCQSAVGRSHTHCTHWRHSEGQRRILSSSLYDAVYRIYMEIQVSCVFMKMWKLENWMSLEDIYPWYWLCLSLGKGCKRCRVSKTITQQCTTSTYQTFLHSQSPQFNSLTPTRSP